MSMDNSKPGCSSPNCPSCDTYCSPCSDGKFWNKKKWTISGLVAQYGDIDSLNTGTPVSTQVNDISSMNGEWEMDAIAHIEGGVVTYKSGYDSDAMGEIDPVFGGGFADGECGTVYEYTFTGLGDMFQGNTSYSSWTDPDSMLEDCNIRVRLYELKKSATTVDYVLVSAYFDADGDFWETALAYYLDVDVGDSPACDTTVMDVSTRPEFDQEVCHFIAGVFYSETDVWDTDSPTGGIIPSGVTISPLAGTPSWTFEGAGTRVSSL